MYACTYACMYGDRCEMCEALKLRVDTKSLPKHVCIYVCVCEYACIYVCMYVCMYEFMYVCMYVCMYV
jgi:hypothetical protein